MQSENCNLWHLCQGEQKFDKPSELGAFMPAARAVNVPRLP